MDKSLEYRFYDLLSVKLSGDITPEQSEILKLLLHQHPQFQFLYDEVMKPLHEGETLHSREAFDNHYIRMMLYHKGQPDGADFSEKVQSPRSVVRYLKYAALVAATLIGVYFLFQHFNDRDNAGVQQKLSKNEMTTPRGSKSRIVLPDGSKVVLNADSRISYDERFTGENREVTFSGEAFFDIKHDPSHPFIIRTAKADIMVLGTAFNVRSYPQEKKFETSLIRGKIEVALHDSSNRKIILKPSEKLIISSVSPIPPKASLHASPVLNPIQITSITHADKLVAETSWVENKLVFFNKPLAEIAMELERTFNINVRFKTETAKNYRYTGTFDGENLNEILEILRLSKKIKYTLKNDRLVIE